MLFKSPFKYYRRKKSTIRDQNSDHRDPKMTLRGPKSPGKFKKLNIKGLNLFTDTKLTPRDTKSTHKLKINN